MRNLEQSVGVHRRLVGVGKSVKGDDVGTFDFYWNHNRHCSNRKVVCSVHRGQGWECLNIQVLEVKPSGNTWARPALHSEVQKLLPLFFHPHEMPVQFHKGTGDRAQTGLTFWLSERIVAASLHLPEFGPNFTLTKTTL
jgi:hypothetical protein